eukprot:c52122_g1_i1 orf=41-205(+)
MPWSSIVDLNDGPHPLASMTACRKNTCEYRISWLQTLLLHVFKIVKPACKRTWS